MAKFLDLTGLGQFLENVKTWATGLFVAKEAGKGLSANDYTTTEKNKLASLTATKIDVVKVNGSALTPDGSKAVNIDLSDYALSTEVTQEIAEAVSGIQGFEAKVVSSLPGTGQAGILYLVANSGTGQNIYDEYLWITNKYEKLGTREIDLSGYALKTEIPKAVSDLTNDSGYLTAVPSEYVTETELTAKGYQTATQVNTAITGKGYQTSSQVSSAINTALEDYVETSDLASITETEIDALFS